MRKKKMSLGDSSGKGSGNLGEDLQEAGVHGPALALLRGTVGVHVLAS